MKGLMLTLLGVSLDIEQFESSTLEMDLLDLFANNLVTLQSDWLGEDLEPRGRGREELRPIGEEVLGEEVKTFISKLFLLPIEILETGTLAYLRGGGDGVVISSLMFIIFNILVICYVVFFWYPTCLSAVWSSTEMSEKSGS